MEGGAIENILELERKAFVHPYVEVPKFHKIV
jgi:hypothetical protein